MSHLRDNLFSVHTHTTSAPTKPDLNATGNKCTWCNCIPILLFSKQITFTPCNAENLAIQSSKQAFSEKLNKIGLLFPFLLFTVTDDLMMAMAMMIILATTVMVMLTIVNMNYGVEDIKLCNNSHFATLTHQLIGPLCPCDEIQSKSGAFFRTQLSIEATNPLHEKNLRMIILKLCALTVAECMNWKSVGGDGSNHDDAGLLLTIMSQVSVKVIV